MGDKAVGGLGTRVRAVRDRLRLSQGQLAARIGISRSAMAELELGREPLFGTALRVARVVASLDAETTVAGLLLGDDAPRSVRRRAWPLPVNVTLDLGGDPAKRRKLIKLAGVLMLGGLGGGIDLEKVGWVTLHPEHLDARMVDLLRSSGRAIMERRWELPTGGLYSLMRAHLGYLKALLTASDGSPAQVELARVVGEAHVLAGRLADYVSDDEARGHFTQAADLGRTYGLSDVEAFAVLGLANEQLAWVPAEVKLGALTPAVQRYERLTLPLQAWTDVELGEVYARLGREREWSTVMDRAEDAVTRFSEADRAGNFHDWDMTKMAAYRGGNLMDLGQEQRAIDVMTAVLPAMAQRTPAQALSLKTDIAESLRRMGERATALEMAGDIYQVAQREGYAHTVRWATRVFTRAGEHPN